MKSVTVKDLDIKKDEKVDAFLNSDSVFKEASKTYDLETDMGCDSLFCDLYQDWKPESFEQMQEKIAETFDKKLDDQFER